jgi:hypothetical protein
MPMVSADTIIFQVDQTDYYFLTGQDATIPLTMNNTYDQVIDGSLKYSIIQTVNQNGMQYSSSTTNAQSFSVPQGNQTIGINFGTSNTPVTLTVQMEFSYKYNNDDYLVSLEDIIIYFVSNQSEMNNQQNPMQSSSEKIINAPQQQDQSQQSQKPQTTQEKLSNNQLNQDSQSLKQQMEQQIQEQQGMEQAFEQSVMNHSTIQDLHQQLQQQGYELSNQSFQAKSNDTGSFNFFYKNEQGETASVQGDMKEGEITSLNSLTAENRETLREKLNQSKQFQDFEEQLTNEGYNQSDISFSQDANKTTVDLTYKNKKNETATITAEFKDGELQEIQLNKQQENSWYLWIFLFLISLFLCIFFFYRRFSKKKQGVSILPEPVIKKPFDYRLEAQRLLTEAKKDFEAGYYKDAYGKAGQSLRLFLSHHHQLYRELTNDEIIIYLKQIHHPHDHIKQCLDLCSLVEFAKYQANELDFLKIIQITKSVILS